MKRLCLPFISAVVFFSCLSTPELSPNKALLREFPASLQWKNVTGSLHLSDISGYTTILAFFDPTDPMTVRELFELDEMHGGGVLSIAVLNGLDASPFAQKLISRYGLSYPMVVDPASHLAHSLGVRGYPSYVIVSGNGVITGGIRGSLRDVDRSLFDELTATVNNLSRWKIPTIPFSTRPRSILTYPSAVVADRGRNIIYVSDSGGHRVLAVQPQSGEVLAIAGTGTRGAADGPIREAQFNVPLGMALSADGNSLLVADSGNSTLRSIDLRTRMVSTIAAFPDGIPYDVAVSGSSVYVSIGGQGIAKLDTSSGDYMIVHSPEAPLSSRPYDEGWGIITPFTYRADSMGHTIRVEDASLGTVSVLPLHGDPLYDRDRITPVVLPHINLGAGRGIIRFTTAIPAGYELVEKTLNHAHWSIEGGGAQIVAGPDPNSDIFQAPIELIVDLLPGEGELSLELSLIYRHTKTGVMYAHSGTMIVPYTVGNAQQKLYTLEYRIPFGSKRGRQY